MNTWLPQISGVASPRPGIFTFHLMLLVSLQVVGGSAVGLTPVISGPRHCGQFESSAVNCEAAKLQKLMAAKAVARLRATNDSDREALVGAKITRSFKKGSEKRSPPT